MDALKHILKEEKSYQLWMVLSYDGYESILYIASLTNKEIDELNFKESISSEKDTDKVRLKTVVKKQRKLLLHLLLWRDWKSKQLISFGVNQWMELSKHDFEEFRTINLPDIIRGIGKGSSTYSSGDLSGIITSDEVNSFKKSIDKSQLYSPEFNEDIAK